MAPSVLKEFNLPVDIDDFLSTFWLDNKWYEMFLIDKLEDINVTIGDWTEQGPGSKTRQIKSYHPSKISFPGLPSHAEVQK